MLLRDLEARFCGKGVSSLDLRPCRSDYNELAFEKSLFSGELVTSLRRHAPRIQFGAWQATTLRINL